MESIIEQILLEQRKTNELLLALIEAIAEPDEGEDGEPVTYMDGTHL